MEKPVQIGSIVLSTAGRDSGRYFIVTEIVDDKFVKLADGDLRRLDKPKLKKIKHVKNSGELNEKLREKLITGATIYDAEIYSVIRRYE